MVLLLCAGAGFAFDTFDQAFGQMRHRYSLGHYKRVLAIVPYALKLSASNDQKYKVIYYQGLALDSMFDFWAASQAFEKAAMIENISPQQALQARFNQIKSQYANQHFISALANAEKYSVFTGKPSTLHFHILFTGFEAARELNRNEKALELAQKLIAISSPESAWYYRGRIMEVEALCQMKKYEQAEAVVKKTDTGKVPLPMLSEFFAWSGYCHEKDKHYELAAKSYALAYEKDKGYYAGLAALRHANLLEREKGKATPDQIAAKYAKVVEFPEAHSNHKSQAIYKLACIYQQQHKPETALRYLALADSLKAPSAYWQAKIYNLHGDILYKQGKIAMAKKYFQECLKISENLPDSKLYAREILAQMEGKRVLPEKQ